MRKDTIGLIQSTLDYMEENLKTELDVQELCQMAGYSYYHYCQLFQRAVGMPVKQYLVCRRLKHATYEMSQGAKKQETAMEYGFDTYAGFYKAFCREYGMSPAKYLKAYQPSYPYKIDLLQEGKLMISKKMIKKLLTHWGMEDCEITNVRYEGSNQISENEFSIGEEYVLKLSGIPGGLKRHMAIAEALNDAGLQASLPVPTKSGEFLVQEADVYAMVCQRVKGSKIGGKEMFATGDKETAYRFGTLIGKLHQALGKLDDSLCQENHLYNTVWEWALPMTQKKVTIPQELAAEYCSQFGEVYDKLPKQIIHRNMNLSYVYLNGEEMVGITDFELSEYSIRLFDVCYATTGILSENFSKEDGVMQKWLPLYQSIIKGYDEVVRLTEEEKKVLPYVVLSIQFICVAYFADKEQFVELAKVNEQMLMQLVEHKEDLGFYCKR